MSKYSPQLYAQALSSAWQEAKPDQKGKVLSRFLDSVFRRGDWPQLKKILLVLEEMRRSAKGQKLVSLESARKLKPKAVERLKAGFDPDDSFSEKEDPRLIAGIRLIVDGRELLDYSLKNRLENIFRQNSCI